MVNTEWYGIWKVEGTCLPLGKRRSYEQENLIGRKIDAETRGEGMGTESRCWGYLDMAISVVVWTALTDDVRSDVLKDSLLDKCNRCFLLGTGTGIGGRDKKV